MGKAVQEAEFRAARQRILDEAERQRGKPEARHRWNDGPTIRLTPLTRQAPLLTYGQKRGYRCGQ
ncbi:hypothetical protein ABT336_01435 [Micromonospora sp. NPDC000207]|uniref:hypothetical protein n=1 Tax=Micromonospora sp. NPDC000207 TaxID=3154246 RepID=UPI00333169E2